MNIIDIKKLDEKIDIWHQANKSLGINIQTINIAIRRHDIFEKNDVNEPDTLNMVRRIAYRVANGEVNPHAVIDLNLFTNSREKVLSGWEDLLVSVCLKEKSIGANIVKGRDYQDLIIGDTNIAPQETQVKSNVEENINSTKITKKTTFDWKISASMLEDSWGNRDFVLEQLKESSERQILKLAQPKLWKDPEFVSRVYRNNRDFYKNVQVPNIYEVSFFNIAITIPAFIRSVFTDVYQSKYQVAGYESLTHLIDTQLLTNKELVINVLKYDRNDNNNQRVNIFTKLPLHIRYDSDVVETFFNLTKEVNSLSFGANNTKYFEPEFFENPQNLKLFLQQGLKGIYGLKDYPFLTQSWIHDKEKVLDMLDGANKEFNITYAVLPLEIKNDPDVAKRYLIVDKDLYNDFDKSLKHNWAVIETFLFLGGYIHKVPKEALLALTNPEHIEECLKKNPQLLKEKNCPKSWHENTDFIIYSDSIESFMSEEKVKLLYQNMNFMKKWFSININAYRSLPYEIKNQADITLLYLESKNKSSTMDLDLVPKELFSSKVFCINAIDTIGVALKSVPKPYWNDRDIMLSITRQVDSGNISAYQFKESAPTEVIHFFESFGIKKDYHSFLKSYFLNVDLEENLPKKELQKMKTKI